MIFRKFRGSTEVFLSDGSRAGFVGVFLSQYFFCQDKKLRLKYVQQSNLILTIFLLSEFDCEYNERKRFGTIYPHLSDLYGNSIALR